MKSELFGKEYLCCYARKSWFDRKAPDFDALATTSIVFLGIIDSPPAVIIPEGKSFKSQKMRSILEHEFVHVNQAILGCIPSNFEHGDGDLCQEILDYTLGEYEANFLQLARWPVLLPKFQISLEEWCVLRGYTQALECFILSGLRGSFPERKLFATIDKVERASEKTFMELGASAHIARKFAQSTRRFAQQALGHIPHDFSPKAARHFIAFLEGGGHKPNRQ